MPPDSLPPPSSAVGSKAVSPRPRCRDGWRAARLARWAHHAPSRPVSAIATALLAASTSACDGPALLDAPTEPRVRLDGATSEPLATPRRTAPSLHCDGSPLPECPGGLTGPSCTLPCSPTSPGSNEPTTACSFDLYCHGDGSVYGLAAMGAALYPGTPESPSEALAALVAFVTTHESDLGVAPGLEPQDLGLVSVPGSGQRMGGLRIHRFSQTYRGRPVLPPDDLVQVVYGPAGAIQLSGQIIDGRIDYEHHDQHARPQLVADSIRHHAHVRSSVRLADLVVDPPVLVAMPESRALAWMAHARHVGGNVLARVLVDAAPNPAQAILPLVSYRPVAVADLASTSPIEVLTVDPATDPASPGTGVATTLVGGEALLGSIDDVSGEVQLAADAVVVLDLNGGSVDDLDTVGSRITSPTGEFLEASGPGFSGQMTYHLLRSWYARIDEYLTDPGSNIKRWDSAYPIYEGGAQSPTPAGTFAPRVLALIDSSGADCPPTAVACASPGGYSANHPDAMVFPELAHQPPGASPGYEVIGQVHISPPGETSNAIITLAHELGHLVDLFAGPGFTAKIAPDCGDTCAFECIEDTSDEAPALGETIAHLSGMLLLQGSFEPANFEHCDIVGLFSRNNTKAFDPGPCLPVDEDISLLQRDAACAKAEPYCDKPDQPGFWLECCDPALDADCDVEAPTDCPTTGFQRQRPTGLCHTSPGYNTHSIMQAFWQLLHGERCEPTAPFSCELYEWPGGIAPADAITPAFLYSLRLDPLSYDQLFDGMATYIACAHGVEAYEEFNAVMCAHDIRACEEPAPVTCETCGNGVREGEETCDGLDWSATSCADFDGYVGGELSCDAATCQLDLDQCTTDQDGGLDTTAGTDDTATMGEAEHTVPADTDGPATGPGDGDLGGCACRADARPHPFAAGAWLLMLLGSLAHRRRSARVRHTLE